jgi:hypothetical protein
MPYQRSPEIDFSSIGLMVDVPSSQVPQGGWSDSLNVRARNGSVEGVNSFATDIVLHPTDNNIAKGISVAVTQFTPAGGDNLVIAYIVDCCDGYGAVIVYDASLSGNARWNNITNTTLTQKFTLDQNHPPQIFVFNELLIVNPGTDAPPQFTTATTSAGSLVEIPGWLYDTSTVAVAATALVAGNKYTILTVGTTNFTLIGASANTVGVTFTCSAAGTGTGTATITSPIIARVLKPFNSRLIGMNIKEEHDAGAADDKFQPIDLIWSSNIQSIASILKAEWTASTTNTAGDAFLVDTPGKILDGGQLGNVFIAYKSDSVVRIRETGDSFVLALESIFEDDGIYSTRCFANIGNSQHIVVGNYGIYVHDGQSQKQDIAKGLFKDTMYALVPASNRNRAFVFQQTRDSEVWLCLPTTTDDPYWGHQGCQLAFVYDYGSSKIHKRTLPDVTDMFETEQNGELKIYGTGGLKDDCLAPKNLLVLQSDRDISPTNPSVLEPNGYFERQNDNLGDNTTVKHVSTIEVNASGPCNLAITGTMNLSDAKSYSDVTFNPVTQHKVDVRTSGRYMNLRVTMSGDTDMKLSKLQFKIKGMGVR